MHCEGACQNSIGDLHYNCYYRVTGFTTVLKCDKYSSSCCIAKSHVPVITEHYNKKHHTHIMISMSQTTHNGTFRTCTLWGEDGSKVNTAMPYVSTQYSCCIQTTCTHNQKREFWVLKPLQVFTPIKENVLLLLCFDKTCIGGRLSSPCGPLYLHMFQDHE